MLKIFGSFLVACVIASGFLVCDNAYSQQAIWSDVANLSGTEQDTRHPNISISSDGTRAAAVWMSTDGVSEWMVHSAIATISGNVASWGLTSDLSIAGQSTSVPRIALSSDGTKAIAIWGLHVDDSSSDLIQSASATISGDFATWSAASTLSVVGALDPYHQVALSSDGSKATAIWSGYDGLNYIVQSASATISRNVATWSSASGLSVEGQDAHFPQVALSSDGAKATAIWRRHDGLNNIIQSASAVINENMATWSSAANLSIAGKDANFPQIALSSDGAKALAAWSYYDGSNGTVQNASAMISGNTANWSAGAKLTDGGLGQIALSSDGTKASAVWSYYDGLNWIVQSASASISGNTAIWGLVANLSAAGHDAQYSQIAISSDGDMATALWSVLSSDNWPSLVQSASAKIGRDTTSWGATRNVSAHGIITFDHQIELSSDGTRATALWSDITKALWSNASNQNAIVQSASATIDYQDDCFVIKSSNGSVAVFCL